MTLSPLLKNIVLIFIALQSFQLQAQTIFSFGKHKVSKEEFLNAYTRNNTDTSGKKISYSEYLELYKRFKLKVQAALDERLDTLSEQQEEFKSFRYQLADNYMKEDGSVQTLIDEAGTRQKKDIHLADIFIPVSPSDTEWDINEAKKKLDTVYAALLKGTSEETAAAGLQRRDIGWITVFVLPYQVESIAYNTPVEKYAAPFRTSSGIHLLHNVEERQALGDIRVAQILLSYPPGAGEVEKAKIGARADSLYKALQQGADFGSLAVAFSNDIISFQSRGEMPAFGVGRYDSLFEKQAFALQNDGDISKPFTTEFGYHIIQRLARLQPSSAVDSIREKVLASDRIQEAQKMLVLNIRNKTKANEQDSDSAVLDYYRNHLETYSKEFSEQLEEFRQGNLLFTIMQKKVWDAASSDSAGLLRYYNDHKQNYTWENSADAVIVTSLRDSSGETLQEAMKDNIGKWRKWAEDSRGAIQADSGRFELGQIPVVDRTNFTEGLVTAPVKNEQDGSNTAAYIIRLHKDREIKTFEEARGAVINDYQMQLEEQWIAQLEKRYPVRINKKLLRQLESQP